MNPFARKHIDQIDQLVADLGTTLQEYERRLQQAQQDKESKLKEHWAVNREVRALRETIQRLPDLEEENHQLREQGQKSLDHARRILELAKALSGGIER